LKTTGEPFGAFPRTNKFNNNYRAVIFKKFVYNIACNLKRFKQYIVVLLRVSGGIYFFEGMFIVNWTKSELVKLWTNNEKRREFFKNYKEWGVWLTVPELGLVYYKYTLPDGGRIVAMEYQSKNPYPAYGGGEIQTTASYYLWDGEYFSPTFASDYEIVDRLKKLKVTLQAELRSEPVADA